MLYPLVKPLLFCLDAERAHDLTITAMRKNLVPGIPPPETPGLKVSLWNKMFPNPLGLAAGFDKNAAVIGPVLGLGFGFTEVGTVTPRAQPGNPKPRIFRETRTHAVINRMGFPNQGLRAFQENLTHFLEQKPRPPGLVGLNIGMNKDTKKPEKDYAILIRALAPMADYLTVNISSPNTPGLRNFQKPENFKKLIGAILEERARTCGAHPPPVLVKLAPDLKRDEQKDLARLAVEMRLEGLILSNTTLARPKALPQKFAHEKGGLSGAPLREKADRILKNFYRLTEGQIPLVGVGGIETADHAYQKIKNGATLIQLYTGLVYQGPSIAHDILAGLQTCMERDGYDNITQAIGADVT